MKIIVGLGNPGEQYKNTRHNIGWLALDRLAGDIKWTENKKFQALTYQEGDYFFIKPLTFMNNSGQSVQKVLNYYKLLPKNLGLIKKKNSNLGDTLLVIHDELDLDFGNYRLATDSGSAGHRGVQSIIDYLKTQQFKRLRLGIKTPLLRDPIPPDKFVLQPFTAEEKNRLPEIITQFNLKDLI